MSGDKIENSTVGQLTIKPSPLHEQYFRECLAKQAETQGKMHISIDPETALRTVDQCNYVANLQLFGSIPPFIKPHDSSNGDLIKQAAEQGGNAILQNPFKVTPAEK